ncbi:unnamed protein product [Amoebophrya sp. A25]|nr:unnamed protein product [Amoebophrya sp. A25]|eukprot:GSA25T00024682001.1
MMSSTYPSQSWLDMSLGQRWCNLIGVAALCFTLGRFSSRQMHFRVSNLDPAADAFSSRRLVLGQHAGLDSAMVRKNEALRNRKKALWSKGNGNKQMLTASALARPTDWRGGFYTSFQPSLELSDYSVVDTEKDENLEAAIKAQAGEAAIREHALPKGSRSSRTAPKKVGAAAKDERRPVLVFDENIDKRLGAEFSGTLPDESKKADLSVWLQSRVPLAESWARSAVWSDLAPGSLYAFRVSSPKHIALAHRLIELLSAKKRDGLTNPAASNHDIFAVACWSGGGCVVEKKMTYKQFSDRYQNISLGTQSLQRRKAFQAPVGRPNQRRLAAVDLEDEEKNHGSTRIAAEREDGSTHYREKIVQVDNGGRSSTTTGGKLLSSSISGSHKDHLDTSTETTLSLSASEAAFCRNKWHHDSTGDAEETSKRSLVEKTDSQGPVVPPAKQAGAAGTPEEDVGKNTPVISAGQETTKNSDHSAGSLWPSANMEVLPASAVESPSGKKIIPEPHADTARNSPTFGDAPNSSLQPTSTTREQDHPPDGVHNSENIVKEVEELSTVTVGAPGQVSAGMMSEFYAAAVRSPTDKITSHSYQTLYGKYLPRKIDQASKPLLEIGLGCVPFSVPGSSGKMWRRLGFRSVHILEYNGNCVRAYASEIEADGYKVYIGDQSNMLHLEKVKDNLNYEAEVIVDDGGHWNSQILASFWSLWPIVRNGGLYFVEDFAESAYIAKYVDQPGPVAAPGDEHTYTAQYGLASLLRNVFCGILSSPCYGALVFVEAQFNIMIFQKGGGEGA